MINPKFSMGESVKVKGSSVIISIFSIINPDERRKISYICKWIDDNKQPKQEIYKEEMLEFHSF